MIKFVFLTEDSLMMVSEEEAEKLAKIACEKYMTDCNLQNIEDAKLAAQKMLAVAHDLFDTMHDGNMKIDILQ